MLPAVEASSGWSKASDSDRLRLPDRLTELQGLASTDRTDVAKRLGAVPKALDKALWDAISVRDPEAPVVTDRTGNPQPDPELRDNENVPLPGPAERFDEDPTERLATPLYREAVDAYMAAEVLPYVPDAWVDPGRTRIGYEIPLTRQFYTYVPPRPLEEIDAEIRALEDEIQRLLKEVTA